MPFIKPYKEPTTYIDYNKVDPIGVITNFASDGNMLPIYVRYIHPDQSEETILVDGVKYAKDVVGGKTYCCLVTINDCQKQIFLTYYVKEHLWVIAK